MQTPYWLLEEKLLKKNLELLKYVKEQTGVKILLALKGYALWQSFDLISKYLDGCCASGLYEAILSDEEFKRETHSTLQRLKKKRLKRLQDIKPFSF